MAGQRPEGLVQGGAFIDLIRPIPVDDSLTSNCWGVAGVKPRVVNNGIEDPKWSYWCASRILGPDGREHLFLSRWPQNKGHKAWPSSRVVHVVGDHPTGPFQVVGELGDGHNPDVYRTKDGTYVVAVNRRAYKSKDLNGPWTEFKQEFDTVDHLVNLTFAMRPDGSFLMLLREGTLWLSNDGLQPFRRINPQSVYPFKSAFEDPCLWRDEVQYHLIMNNWEKRYALYGRSKDGFHWIWDYGPAYHNLVVRHPDGGVEQWDKAERPKVRQDEYGRATHLYLAVVDCPKDQCDGKTDSSSKAVVVPLTVGRRLAILNEQPITADTKELRLEVKAEPGFDPQADVDVKSLTFGAPDAVNFGKGCKALRSEPAGKNLVVTFDGAGHGLKARDYVAKLIGKTTRGDLLFGYARLPGQAAEDPVLIARTPALVRRADGTLTATAVIENIGLAASTAPTPVKLTLVRQSERAMKGKVFPTAAAAVAALPTYGTASIELPAGDVPAGEACDLTVVVNPDQPNADSFLFRKLTAP